MSCRFLSAIVEAEIWRELQVPPRREVSLASAQTSRPPGWSKPSDDWVKCNVAASWSNRSVNSGGAWIVRNGEGEALMHSRRSFSNVDNPLGADLCSLLWSIKAMRDLRVNKIIFESSSAILRESFLNPLLHPQAWPMVSNIHHALEGFAEWRVEHVVPESNKVASLIAVSVTSEHRYQSYVASGGPSWLQTLLEREAVSPHR